jgi:uncharacterized protein YndB with AHSA1/START domain
MPGRTERARAEGAAMTIIPLERFLIRRFGGVRTGWRTLVGRHWLQRLDRLAGYLVQLKETGKMTNKLHVEAPAGEPITIMTRTFDAPRALVWKVMSDPRHIARWWGGKSYTTKVVVAKHDFRKGGEWRFESHGLDGNVYVFLGEFREIVPPEKVVQTFGMEGMFEGRTIVETLTLEEVAGRTNYKVVSLYDSIEDRDAMVVSMEGGAQETLDQIEEILLELQQAEQQQQ